MNEKFLTFQYSLATQRNSFYKEKLNVINFRIKAANIIDRLFERYFKWNVKCEDNRIQTTHGPLLITQLAPVFYMIFALLLFTLVTFFIEKGMILAMPKSGTKQKATQPLD